MKTKNLIANAEIAIEASRDEVWNALINPDLIKKYMFGTTVISDWKEGSKIIWKGEWKGKTYEDKGEILDITPKKKLSYTHYSPLAGQPDIPENYHTVIIEINNVEKQAKVTLTQDNNSTEEDKLHSEENWAYMLTEMKKILE